MLNNIVSKNDDKLDLLNKHKLNEVILNILNRYCSGELGIDQSDVTKYCIFHNRLFKYFNKIVTNQYLLGIFFLNIFENFKFYY